MSDDMVMRSVYLRPTEDSQLRQLAHELRVTKSDLIRSAISVKLREWLDSNSDELVLHDLTFGQRDDVASRAVRAATVEASPTARNSLPAVRASVRGVGEQVVATAERPAKPTKAATPIAGRRTAMANS